MTTTGHDGTIGIRLARPDDAERIQQAIRALGQSLGLLHKIISAPEDFRRYGFGDAPAFRGFIAEKDKSFAGVCLFFPIFSTWIGKPGVYVLDLYVEDHCRQQGVGKALIRKVAAWSQARGGAYLRLAVNPENPGAIRFYEKLGICWLKTEREHGAYEGQFTALAAPE